MPRIRGAVEHLRPRRLWLYGVGNGRSGTTSLSEMFSHYRTGHEEGREVMRALAARVLRGELDPNDPEVRRALRRRRWRYHLEVDVAGNLSPFAGTAAAMYPQAKFVLMIRDCFSWLDSRVEHTLNYGGGTGDFARARFTLHDDPYSPEEAPLRAAGLLPLASYLRAWADASDRVLGGVPGDRLLVVRTEDLSMATGRLADFAGVPESTLVARHANPAPARSGILAQVPPAFVVARAEVHCGALMARFWGADWTTLVDRLPTSS